MTVRFIRRSGFLSTILLLLTAPLDLVCGQTSAEVLKSLDIKNPERRSKLVDGAKREGRLVFYGTLAVDASRPFLEFGGIKSRLK